MPNMTILNAGKQLLLDQAFAESESGNEDYVVALYQNNHTPLDPDTASNFTVCNFTGYANVTVPRSSFNAAVIVSNLAVLTSTVSPTYNCTGGNTQTAYGFVVLGNTSGTAYAAQAFNSGLLVSNGLSVVLTPFQFELGSL
jgi:hypothetical protein